MNEDWVEVTVHTPADPADVLSLLNDPAASGAWEENGLVHLYWPSRAWSPSRLAGLRTVLAQLGHPATEQAIAIGSVADRDWNEAWARAVQPIRLGRVVIRRSWQPVNLSVGDVELILDPKQAFGTGHHATTQLLIEWLQEAIAGGETVLDLGTGSGILAMAALRVGAGRAVGLDHDPVAIDYARDYAKQNGFGEELTLQVGAATALCEQAPCSAGLVLANLDRQTIMDCRGVLARHAQRGARLLLSGVLIEQLSDITQALSLNGIYVQSMREREGWLAFDAAAGPSCDEAPEGLGL